MLDVLLVKPPRNADMATHGSLPMSLACLAGTLRRRFGVGVLDLQFYRYEELPDGGLEWDRPLSDEIRTKKPRVIGITCLFSGDIEKILAMAERCKAIHPGCAVVVGGVHPTIYGREILENCPHIDFVVKGEGDETVVELVSQIMRGEAADFSVIDGLVWRTADGTVREQAKTRYIEDLDQLPRPAYDLFPIDSYTAVGTLPNPKNHVIRMNFPFITSRSCGRSCNFCSLHNAMGYKARMRSPGKVLDDLEYLYHTYGLNYFDIEDDNFAASKRRVIEICDGIRRRNLDIQFRLRNGVYIPSIDGEVAAALADAGLVMAYLAIESGSEFIRNRVIGKNVPTEKIVRAAEALARHPQVTLGAFFIVGMPEETTGTIHDTVALIESLPLDLFVFMPATPYPGTRLYEQCVRDGLFIEPGGLSGLWRRPCRIEQTISTRNPIMIRPYNMTLEELDGHCRRLADMGSAVMFRSQERRNGARMRALQTRLREIAGAEPLLVFGAGIYGRLGRRIAEAAGIAIGGVLDNNRDLWGSEVEGVRVMSPAEAPPGPVFICVLNRLDAERIDAGLAGSGAGGRVLLGDYLQ